jgi:hypothetical protein
MSKTKPQKIGKTISQEKTTKIAQEDKLLESNEKLEEKKETLNIREFKKQYYKLKEYYTIFLKKYDPILKEYNTKLIQYYTKLAEYDTKLKEYDIKLEEGKNLNFEDIKSIIQYFEDIKSIIQYFENKGIESIIQYFEDIESIIQYFENKGIESIIQYFEDIESIIQYFKYIRSIIQDTKEHINNEKFLDSTITILNKDIALRNQNTGIDCIEKLYEYNEILREEFRLKKPKQDDKKALIREKLRAIIMDNYRKNYNYIGKEFIDKKLNYEDYKKGIDILNEKTFSLLLKVKVITQS